MEASLRKKADAAMPVTRLNHAVLFVRELDRSLAFYRDVLGFEVLTQAPNAAFLRAPGSTNDHDLGLFAVGSEAGSSEAGRSRVGLYHLAWEVDTLAELARFAELLTSHGALVGASDHGTTKALYAHDPDGLEFEMSWLVPADQLADAKLPEGAFTLPLDLAREIERYGAERRGGVGVSHAVVS
jgi:catechol-2,3-dioxygenase